MSALLGLAIAVFVLDAVTTYLGIKDREAWIDGNIKKGLAVEALLTIAIGVNICAFVEFTWLMILPSTIGSLLGRWAAWRW